MRQSVVLAVLCVIGSHAAPQLISFTDGKLGVNFGGYHAGVGLGGLVGGGTAGGLFAEAGTPHGQHAKAGLGGVVDSDGNTSGGLFAGATAGGNVKAETGLAGGVLGGKAAGSGFATAQAGDHVAASGLGGESSVQGKSGFKFSGTKSFGGTTGVIEQTDIIQPVEVVKPEHKKIHKEFKFETVNEVVPQAESNGGVEADVSVRTNVQPLLVKEVFIPPSPPVLVEKQIIHYKPRRHHFHRKTAYIGGYLGGEDVPPPVVHKVVHAPVIQKRIDVDVESAASAGADLNAGGDIGYTKQVTWQRNPNFFADIFNIPIQTLKAVSNLVSNTAGGVSVQKTATVHADSDISSKHVPLSSSSDTQVSVNTGKIIDDIFSIPINTLGAVNRFLENNVPARKKVIIEEGDGGEVTRIRRRPHGRRAHKEVVILKEGEAATDE